MCQKSYGLHHLFVMTLFPAKTKPQLSFHYNIITAIRKSIGIKYFRDPYQIFH